MDFITALIKQDIGVYWYPAVMLIILVILMLVFYLWGRIYFRRDYNSGTDQVKPFNSGNLDEIDYSLQSSNLYWGFRKSMDVYFKKMNAMHNGDLNEYIQWFILFAGVCFLLVGGGLL